MAATDILHLPKNDANYVPLTPLSFLHRAAQIWPNRISTTWELDFSRQTTWMETYEHSKRVATSLVQRYGIRKGDVVGIIARNIEPLFEAHYAIPMSQGVLLTMNIRIDPSTIAYCLENSQTKVFLVDRPFVGLVQEAMKLMKDPSKIQFVDILDRSQPDVPRLSNVTWDDLCNVAPALSTYFPDDEWQPCALSYTSGTTGNPKGVVYHHRGAYLMSMGSIPGWDLRKHCTYMCTVPMFHCNGWAFPWTAAIVGAKLVLLDNLGITGKKLWDIINTHKVTNFGGAPIVLNTLVSHTDHAPLHGVCNILVAGAPPTPATLKAVADAGFNVMQVYGLTETYGHTVQCEPQEEWATLSADEQSKMKARQGVPYPQTEGLDVWDDAGHPVPRDGQTPGEIVIRGNCVMSGYLNNPAENEKAFKGGWFHSGDAAVIHPNNYIQITDRFKDIIISGGENISSVAVEAGVASHPSILNVAVVAMPSEKYGETPCCFFELKEGAKVPSEDELRDFCKANLPRFMCPARFLQQELPKTASGKIQKFELRKAAKALAEAAPKSKL